jgi:DNA-directed RNA polymerase subunit K/omega
MPAGCSAGPFDFAPAASRAVVAGFDGGAVTPDAGALLPGATDRAIGLARRSAACSRGARVPGRIGHAVTALAGQRALGVALGRDDLLDHDQLRHDPVLAALAVPAGELEAGRAGPGRLRAAGRQEHS